MLRLKEKPSEWIKFTAVMGLSPCSVLGVLWWKGALPGIFLGANLVVALLLTIVAWIRPHWFRGFYRWGMTFSYHVGQIIGKVMLILFFFIVVTPMALALRLLGKDLLRLRKTSDQSTYWQKAKSSREFDRMF
jgi:hypothetical protein